MNVTDRVDISAGSSPSGKACATFGCFVRGMNVPERIQAMPTDGSKPMKDMQWQSLHKTVPIRRAYRWTSEK